MLALGTIRTETNQPIWTHDLAHVTTLAIGTVLAEAARIPGTLLDL